MILTQSERAELAEFDTRDKRVANLLHMLEGEIINMVPWRHYGALVNCLKQVQQTLIRTQNAVAKADPELYREVCLVLDIVEGHFRDGRIGEVPDMNEQKRRMAQEWANAYTPFSPPPPPKKRGRPKRASARKK